MKYQVLTDYLNKHYNMSTDGYDLHYTMGIHTQYETGHCFDELNKSSENSASTLLSFSSPKDKPKPSIVTSGNYHFGYNQDILDMICAINKTPRKQRLNIEQLYQLNIRQDLEDIYHNKYKYLDRNSFDDLIQKENVEDINKLYHDKYAGLDKEQFNRFIRDITHY